MSLTNRLFSEAFRDMQRAVSALDHPVLNTVGPLIGNRLGSQVFHPAADLVETPKAYELHADLPGFDKNNIKIEMPDSRTLILSGSVNEQHESSDATAAAEGGEESTTTDDASTDEKSGKEVATTSKDNQVAKQHQGGHYWVNERVSGAFSRSFRFPSPVNTENITASFKDGTLKVLVPKSAEEQPKKISID
ncbi:hypothetical protein INT47_003140 [Mucor saturninus]|uniref:SHSP domain-containing protein n=1 Tax=Mucor saturninus TaxID=64648 RepID=A0A8H7QZ37_9FUNG|nr:hypothetical protein INT47_003140 [Mucor saturninus]